MKLTVLPAIALLALSVPASASSLILGEPVAQSTTATAKDSSDCVLPRLSIRTDSFTSLRSNGGGENAFDSTTADNRWASGATSHWNAGMNRAVDHLFQPPEHVSVYATQTGDDLPGHYEGSNGPNQTFAAFEVVIH